MTSQERRDDSATKRPGPGGPPEKIAPAGTLSPVDAAAHETPSLSETGARGSFGTLLEPVLRQACDGRLSPVSWFRADWQRGGALTGYATFTDERGEDRPAVVKLPVPPCERYWLVTLQDHDSIVPEVFAHGETLGGYDLAWVVMERLPHGPLSAAWDGREFDLLLEAAARFYAASQHETPRGEPDQKDWEAILDHARKRVRDHAVADAQRWSKALKQAHRRVKQWAEIWNGRPTDGWCHGDLHLGNAMTRNGAPEGPALLFDFARTRVGHWLEDAVYFEHLFWARRDRLDGRKPVRQLAHERKRLGLPVDEDWPRLADAKRALLAMSTPAQLTHDGDPQHVHAALEVLERAVA